LVLILQIKYHLTTKWKDFSYPFYCWYCSPWYWQAAQPAGKTTIN